MSSMTLTTSHKILIALVVVAVAGYIIFDKKADNSAPKDTGAIATTTSSDLGEITVDGTGGYTIKKISETALPAGSKVTMPDLNRAVIFGSSMTFDANTKRIYTEKIQALQAELKKDPSSFANWLELGLYQKAIGDYEGAAITWKYVSVQAPKDYISLGNLGNLYAYYLKDNAMAETYYLQAIKVDPKHSYLYLQLSDVYLNVFKDLSKAKSIIDQGLKILPEDKSLIEMKAALNK